MRKLYLVIPISAVAIAGLVGYRMTRPERETVPAEVVTAVRPMPMFQIYDEHSQIVRVSRYVGRHKLLIVFFDDRRGLDRSGLLQMLKDDFAKLHETRVVILAIGSEQSAKHRMEIERVGRFPFPILSDVLDYQVHRLFGAYDEREKTPREAVFVVDGTGMIRHAHLGPEGLLTIEEWVKELEDVK